VEESFEIQNQRDRQCSLGANPHAGSLIRFDGSGGIIKCFKSAVLLQSAQWDPVLAVLKG